MNGRGRALRRRQRLAAGIGALGLAATIVLLTATPAWAHAVLLSTSPAAESVVKVAPKQVELTFGEDVEISFGSIKVFNQNADPVDTGAPHHAKTSDHSVEVTFLESQRRRLRRHLAGDLRRLAPGARRVHVHRG